MAAPVDRLKAQQPTMPQLETGKVIYCPPTCRLSNLGSGSDFPCISTLRKSPEE